MPLSRKHWTAGFCSSGPRLPEDDSFGGSGSQLARPAFSTEYGRLAPNFLIELDFDRAEKAARSLV